MTRSKQMGERLDGYDISYSRVNIKFLKMFLDTFKYYWQHVESLKNLTLKKIN